MDCWHPSSPQGLAKSKAQSSAVSGPATGSNSRRPGSSRRAIRDRAILGLLLGCALRRGELVALEVERMEQRVGRWVLPDLKGKGNRLRTVPVPAWVKELLDAWLDAAAIQSGPVFRPVSKADVVADKALTENSIWWIVREYAGTLDLGKIAPHDLRSYAVCRTMPTFVRRQAPTWVGFLVDSA